MAVLRQATSMPPPDLRERLPSAPAAAAEALCRGMALEPEERQASAGALLDELEAAFGAPEATRRMAPVRRKRTPADVLASADAPAAPPRRPQRRRGRVLAVLALVAALAAVVVVLALARDTGGGGGGEQASATPEPTREAAAEATSEPTEEPQPAATPRALGPAASVRAFYERAAEDDFAGAWRLAGPAMRDVYGGDRAEFERQLGSLERIEFPELAVEARSGSTATVRVSTVATHTDRVDRCSGTLQSTRSGGRWLVEPAGLSCTRG
jgi:hypothetical protein